MAIDNRGISSLTGDAPDLRLEGDVAKIQAIPIEIQNKILEYWIQQGNGSPADRIQDVPEEFRDKIIQLFRQQASAPDPGAMLGEEFEDFIARTGKKMSFEDYLQYRQEGDYDPERLVQKKGGISQLVKPGAGRPGYGGGARGWQAQMKADEIAEDMGFESYYDMPRHLQHKVYSQALMEIDEGLASIADMRRKNEAQGGRIGYESGSESGYTFEDFVKEKRQIDQLVVSLF